LHRYLILFRKTEKPLERSSKRLRTLELIVRGRWTFSSANQAFENSVRTAVSGRTIKRSSTSLPLYRVYRSTLKSQIESVQEDVEAIQSDVRKVCEYLKIRSTKRPFASAVVRRFDAMRQSVEDGAAAKALPREVVNAIVQSGSRYADDVNVRCCLARVARWCAEPQSIDIAQEVGFLLGLWPGTGVMDVEERPATTREKFIRERLRGKVPLHATWSEVCEHLIERAQPR
jgi:hypothetical protein